MRNTLPQGQIIANTRHACNRPKKLARVLMSFNGLLTCRGFSNCDQQRFMGLCYGTDNRGGIERKQEILQWD